MLGLPRFVYGVSIASALLMTGMTVAILIGGLVGESLSTDPRLSTLPLASMVIGMAVMAMPAARVLHRHGYKTLFTIGAIFAFISDAFAIAALQYQNFWLWITGMVFCGASVSFVQLMRFAVNPYISAKQLSVALSVFMLGGAFPAIVGPEIATRVKFTALAEFADTFIVLAGIQFIALIFLFQLSPTPLKQEEGETSISKHSQQGLLAIITSVTAYGVMSFVMTATPISMHSHHGLSLDAAKNVIQWHVLAMFLPSLVTGKLIQKIGVNWGIVLGLFCYAITFATTLQGVGFAHFAIGLILLGLGWNILFTCGSTLAALHQNPHFKGTHDTWVFGIQAMATLSAGAILHNMGWHPLQWLALAATAPLAVSLIYSLKYKSIEK